MISKILSTAVKLYLRSQVDRAEYLKVNIIGRNKQILTGYIPQIFLSCSNAVYQELYFSQVELRGADIAFNLPEVLKRQPLKLTEPVFVDLKVKLSAADLQASINSSLLQSGIGDLWRIIATQQGISNNLVIDWITIAIANQELHLTGIYKDTAGIGHLSLSTGISLSDSHTLCLSPLKIVNASSTEEINELKIDLGTDIAIEQLVIESKHILCAGKIRINS